MRRLNKAEMKEIYHQYMVNDFPADELKKWEHLERRIDEGVYFAFGLFHEHELRSYAFFVGPSDRNFVLLDYYAVTANARGKGIGSAFIDRWKEWLPDTRVVLAEVEDPDYAIDVRDQVIRERRIRFYQKNGFHLTDIHSKAFNVDYSIMYLPLQEEQPEQQIKAELLEAYHLLFPDKLSAGRIVVE